MARRAFFSFHYERDIWRASQVKNSWIIRGGEEAGFWNASLEEEARKKGDDAIKRLIDQGLVNTSVTVVLIGAETADRRWVTYEIQKSCEMGHGLVGVRIHGLKNREGYTDQMGTSPFERLSYANYKGTGRETYLSQLHKVHDYVSGDGYTNLGNWIEEAARAAGK